MAEREIVVDHLRLSYEGLFSATELYKLLDTWFRDMGYDKRETKSIERVAPEGKYIEMEFLPWKKITDYAVNEIRLRVIMQNVKEVEVEQDDQKIKLNQGSIQFVFDGYLTTDYENRWEGKPFFYFLRTMFDKYFYRSYTYGFRQNVVDNVNNLIIQLKSFLNLYRYTETQWTKPTYNFPSV